MKAIIADDQPLARIVIRNLLENAGITVSFEATDGAEALKLITATQPDIAILDTDTPILSGIKIVERLRKKRYSGIIIVVSDSNDRFYGKHSANVGANAFINKKEDIKDIISAIEAAQNGYCYFPFSLNGLTDNTSFKKQKLKLLSMQETKVMRYILNGFSTMRIASEMNISNKTVSTYKSRLMDKLECKTLMDLFFFASQNKIC